MSRPADRGPDLVVVGASVRSFAQSASRAGWRVHAADLFGDLDLAEVAATVVPARGGPRGYPANLRAAVARLPPGAWCFTGALENHPDLLAALAAERPLLGASVAAVRAARDVTIVGRAARAAGLRFPETRFTAAGVPRDGSFLVKPLAGAGGRGIERWTGATAARRRSDRRIWQRFVPGSAWSTSHVVSAAGAELLGASRQLLGRTWCAAGRFAWCGAIGVGTGELAAPLRRQFAAVGRMLVGLRLTGVVGVDVVVDRAGRVWVVEVNPRPTASMELFERATGRSIAAAHLAACGVGGAVRAMRPARNRAAGRPWTKAVLFASRATPIDAGMPDRLRALAATWERADGGWAAIADIPRPGQVIPQGGPLLTVLAPRGAGRDPVRPLRRRAAAVVRALSPPAGGAGRRGRRRAGTP